MKIQVTFLMSYYNPNLKLYFAKLYSSKYESLFSILIIFTNYIPFSVSFSMTSMGQIVNN